MKKKIKLKVNFKLILHQMKRFFVLWLSVSIISAVLIGGENIFSSVSNNSVRSVVSFNYDGIELGLDPMGNKFSVYDIKSTEIIKSAAESLEMNLSDEEITSIKNNISIIGNVPGKIIDKITDYTSIIGSDGILTKNQVKDISYNPTQYNISFQYSNLGYSRNKGADLLNEIIEKYKEYFYKSYGYNFSIGNAILTVNYNEYDYTEAVEVMKYYLETMQTYVDYLAECDNTRYVSKTTGYSFNDLSKAIQTLKDEDLSWISSYIISNNITKDKNNLVIYYQYKIDKARRYKAFYQEQLDSLSSMIDEYKKVNTMILGTGNEENKLSYSQPSEMYDKMINMKVEYQKNVSNHSENIDIYKARIEKLRETENINTNYQMVDDYLTNMDNQIKNILDLLQQTATEYYETVSLFNAYNVISKADGSASSYFSYLKSSFSIIIAVELLIMSFYILIAFVFSFISSDEKDTLLFKNLKKIKGENNNGKE